MLLIPCPNCGHRNVSEFRYDDEFRQVPPVEERTQETWGEYLYMRRNALGVQREWWYHRPCGCWLVVERHTKTQDIIRSYLPES